LRRPDHFRRYLGQRVRVRTLAPLEGRRVFLGPLTAVDDNEITVDQDGVARVIRFTEIAQANYEPEPEPERPRR
jgi:ribosome maturation factor RimP